MVKVSPLKRTFQNCWTTFCGLEALNSVIQITMTKHSGVFKHLLSENMSVTVSNIVDYILL